MVAPPPDRTPSEPIPLAPVPRRGSGTAPFPTPLTALVGREREVTTLTGLLCRPDVRLLTLTGPGGVGKTRLALEAAARLESEFADGAVFVPLAAVPEPALVASAIAQSLGVREAGGFPLAETLVSALRGKHLLLVLDNLEHLLDATPLIAQILIASPNLSVLATSRAVLRISGEQNFPVPPLALPDAETAPTVAEVGAAPAVQLFVARAQAVQPDFALTAANATAVAAICQRLDGLPLAIELAAARTRHLPAPTLLHHLEHPLPLLTGGPRDQPTRLQALRDAIGWSYDLLTADEQSFFRRLSVLAGGGSLEAIAAITSGAGEIGRDVLDGVRGLVEQSLLIQTEAPPGEPRYGMLETIREFGLERLEVSGEESATRAAHAAYYLALAEQAEPHLIASGSAAWVERLAIERDNLHTAVTWALRTGNAAAVLRLAGTILSFAYARGEPREGQQWLEAALAAGSAVSAETRVDALFTASALAQVRGDFARSTALSEEGLALARAHGYAFGQARALLALGITAEWQGDLDLAAARYEESRGLMMMSRDDTVRLPHWTLLPVANLADVALLRGDPALAATLAEEAVAGWREVGYLWGIAQALGTAAAAASERGDQVRAARLYDETLTLWLESDDGRGIAGTLAGIAGVANRRGQSERAARLLGAAWGVAESLGVRYLAHHVHAERVLATTQSQLDDHVFDTAWIEGQALSIEQAVAEARRLLAAPASASGPARSSLPRLSPRELDVLRLLVAGHHDREIAAALRVSPRTVQTHVASLFAKFGVNSRVEVTAIAVRRGLV